MIDTTVLLGVGMFTATVLSLVLVILFARSRLVNAGNVTIQINDDPNKAMKCQLVANLPTLASEGDFLASAMWWWWYLRSMSLPCYRWRRQYLSH